MPNRVYTLHILLKEYDLQFHDLFLVKILPFISQILYTGGTHKHTHFLSRFCFTIMNCPVWYPWAHTHTSSASSVFYYTLWLLTCLIHTHTISHALTLTLPTRFSHTAEQVPLSQRFAAYLLIGCVVITVTASQGTDANAHAHKYLKCCVQREGHCCSISLSPSQSCISVNCHGASYTQTHTFSHSINLFPHESVTFWDDESVRNSPLDPILSDCTVYILIKAVIVCEIWVRKALCFSCSVISGLHVPHITCHSNSVGGPWCLSLLDVRSFLPWLVSVQDDVCLLECMLQSTWLFLKGHFDICQPGWCSHNFICFNSPPPFNTFGKPRSVARRILIGARRASHLSKKTEIISNTWIWPKVITGGSQTVLPS